MLIWVMPFCRAKVSVLRRALPRTKKRDLFQLAPGVGQPDDVFGSNHLKLASFRILLCKNIPAGGTRKFFPFHRLRPVPTMMAGPGRVVELEIIAEHGQQVLFQTHHQRMNPSVKDGIRAFEPHLWAVACGEILHMHGSGYYGAGDAQPLADMALHLGAKDHFGASFSMAASTSR